jgi:hypothetical protein
MPFIATLAAGASNGYSRFRKSVAAFLSDPSFSSVVALLHFDNTLAETKGKTVTNNGATFSSSISKFGGYSAQFGASSYLSIPNSTDWNLGSGDFTIEFWVYYPSSAPATFTGHIVGTWRNGASYTWIIYGSRVASGLVCTLGYSTTGSYQSANDGALGSTYIPANTWAHVAIVRSGSSVKTYYNGVLDATKTVNADSFFNAAQPLQIGRNNDAQQFQGNIDDLRITKGVARYTTTFTPPVAAFPDQ